MSIIALDLDQRTADLVNKLKKDLNVGDAAALIRRALAITELAAETAGEEKILTMIDTQKKERRVNLAA